MNELLKQSNQSLQEYLEQQERTEQESFAVKDDSSADWALRKIKQHKQRQEANNALALAEIEKYENWNKKENEKAQRDIDFLQGLLAEYAIRKREEDPKMKTLSLPNGKLSFRKQQPKWNLDKETVIQSLKDADATDLIKVTEEPKLAEIKKVFEVRNGKAINPDTGEVIAGITVEEQPDKFGVNVNE